MTISAVFSSPCALLSISRFDFPLPLLLKSQLLSPWKESCNLTALLALFMNN